jgi:hypothetical protein
MIETTTQERKTLGCNVNVSMTKVLVNWRRETQEYLRIVMMTRVKM